MKEYITKNMLLTLEKNLSERDFKMLRTLREYRYMTTHHFRRLYFTTSASELAAIRTTNYALAKLRDSGLISPFARKIGGIRAGSGMYVWALTPSGARLLAIRERNEDVPRKRSHDPSLAFLEHTLAVSEVFVRLNEMAREGRLSLLTAANEPGCWRSYSGAGGEVKTLKPDMFAITASGEYEDNWLLELDRDTEAPSTVLKKCKQYITYYKTGREQHKYGVFPCVVWIVPDTKRRTALERHIRKSIPAKESRLFLVILMDEMEALLTNGAENFNKERKTL